MLLQRSFGELSSIFTQYAKAGAAGGGSAKAGETLQQTELVSLALDCGITSEVFPMARVLGIFFSADAADASGEAGDRALRLHEFFELLVNLALQRANPSLGQVGHLVPKVPLPLCLEQLLQSAILKSAKRDMLGDIKKQVTLAHGRCHACVCAPLATEHCLAPPPGPSLRLSWLRRFLPEHSIKQYKV